MANYDKNMGIGSVVEGSEMEQVHYCILFDEYVDMEILEIQEKIKEEKTLRNVCLIKIICYPLELFITWLLLDKNWVEERKKQNKIFIKYLKRKVSINDFQIELMDLSRLYLEKKSQ